MLMEHSNCQANFAQLLTPRRRDAHGCGTGAGLHHRRRIRTLGRAGTHDPVGQFLIQGNTCCGRPPKRGEFREEPSGAKRFSSQDIPKSLFAAESDRNPEIQYHILVRIIRVEKSSRRQQLITAHSANSPLQPIVSQLHCLPSAEFERW